MKKRCNGKNIGLFDQVSAREKWIRHSACERDFIHFEIIRLKHLTDMMFNQSMGRKWICSRINVLKNVSNIWFQIKNLSKAQCLILWTLSYLHWTFLTSLSRKCSFEILFTKLSRSQCGLLVVWCFGKLIIN